MKEKDIRPQALFKRYLELAAADVKTYFGKAAYYYGNCPACGADKTKLAFRKLGFDYDICDKCDTLYVNPRPEASAFTRYYQEAPSVRFWATDFYRETAEARRKAIIAPKAEKVVDLIAEYCDSEVACLVDIGAGYGIFCEEIQSRLPNTPVAAIEPSPDLAAVCREKGLKVINKFADDVEQGDLPDGDGITAAVSFELLEHVHNPAGWLEACGRVINKNGLLILTTLSGKGFDLVVLGADSRSIHPPHHLNFFNPSSLKILLERTGYEVLNVSTPGRLDVDIAVKQREDVRDAFARVILDADEQTQAQFQSFLQATNLSSHMMAVARRLK